jgi:predicted PurR-regulated permease PerM
MARKTQYQVQRVLYMLILVGLSLFIVKPFVVPILLAATVALALYPLQIKLEKRKWKRTRAAGLITSIFTVVISIPFAFFLAKGTLLVIEQLEDFKVSDKLKDQGLQQLVSTLKNDLIHGSQSYLGKLPFASFLTEDKINAYLKSANSYLLDFFQNLAMNIPTVILFLVVMILCTYSFLTGAGGIRNFFQEIFGFTDRKMDQLVGIFLRDSKQVYISNIVTGAIQSVIIATGVSLINGADWFLMFFVTLIFSFVPVIGAAPIGGLFAIASFIQGNPTGAIILLALSFFTGIIDNILRPWLASFGQSKAPGIVSFVFVIGGALWLGFPGLFIGLLLGSVVYDTLPLFWDEIGKTENSPGKNLSGFFSFGDKSKAAEETPGKH